VHIDPRTEERWATEFVYGTITVLIVVAGIDIAGPRATAAAAIIVVAAIATWLAHAYADLLGLQLTTGQPTTWADVRRALRGAAPIILAAVPATAAALGATLGLWTSETFVTIANIAALLVLAAAGWFGAQGSGASRLGSIFSAIISTSIGLAIVAMELLVHH
jgi:hypothetical protein